MAIQLVSTKDLARTHGVKTLVYGMAGAGKTTLCATACSTPVIISAEAGLLSLRECDFPVIQVKTITDVHEALKWLYQSEESKQFNWVCVDSITEIAETVLAHEKANSRDPRAAYGNMQDQMMTLVKAFRDLPERNVYVSAKMARLEDIEAGTMLYQPMMPGRQLGPQLPYLFDEVFALRVEKDEEGKPYRVLQTQRDHQYDAKDRSGALEMWEAPSLCNIVKKMQGE